MHVLYTPPKVAPIPVIDLDPARPPEEVAAELRSAALDTGFFYVPNHDVAPETVDAAFGALAGRTRYAMAFFYSPSYYTRIECLPTCLAPGDTPKYEPVIAGEHAAYRLSRSRKSS